VCVCGRMMEEKIIDQVGVFEAAMKFWVCISGEGVV